MAELTVAGNWTQAQSRRGWYVVGVLLIAWVLAYLDRGIINLLAPGIKTEMGLTDTQLSLLLGFAFSASFALAGLPIGFFVDRFNRRNIIVVGVLIWSVATFACGLANSFEALFAARMFVGVGEACLAPAAFSIIADLFPPTRRGRAMGVMMAGSSIGNAASIFIGGLLIIAMGSVAVSLPLLQDLSPTRMIFVIVALPGILVAALLLSFREPPRLIDRSGFIDGSQSPTTGLSVYVWKNRGAFALVYGVLICNYILAQTSGTWVPVILIRIYGVSPGTVGLWLGAIILLVGPAFGFLGGFLADRWSQQYPLNGRMRVALLTGPVLLLFVMGFLITDVRAVLIVFGGLAAFGNMMVGASYSALHDMVPAGLRGRVVALLLFITSLIGIGLGTTLVALVTDFVFNDDSRVQDSLFLVLMPIAALGPLLALIALGPYARVRQTLLVDHQ